MKVNKGQKLEEVNWSVVYTHYHAMKGQLAVHFELIGGGHTFACVEEHVRELKRRHWAVNVEALITV